MVNKFVPPRKETTLTDQQINFVDGLVSGMTRREAVKHAGYAGTTDNELDTCASRLLANVKVFGYYVDQRAKLSSEAVMDGKKWLEYLRLIVVEAVAERDWTGAVAAMREIGKHCGYYEKDNSQKRATEGDVARMKAELTARGMDFTRRNAPPHLQIKPPLPPHQTNGDS